MGKRGIMSIRLKKNEQWVVEKDHVTVLHIIKEVLGIVGLG